MGGGGGGGGALPPPKTFVQDMPPAGGYIKPVGFPVAGFRKRSPARGPLGIWLVGGTLGMMAFSLYRLLGDVEERKCVTRGWRAHTQPGRASRAMGVLGGDAPWSVWSLKQ